MVLESHARYNRPLGQTTAVQATAADTGPLATMTPPPEEDENDQKVATEGPTRYQALENEISYSKDEIKRNDAAAKQNKNRYDKLREEKKQSIGMRIEERHKAESTARLEELERSTRLKRSP